MWTKTEHNIGMASNWEIELNLKPVLPKHLLRLSYNFNNTEIIVL